MSDQKIPRGIERGWSMLVDWRAKGQTQQQIASKHGISQPAVSQQIAKAKRVLREMGGRI